MAKKNGKIGLHGGKNAKNSAFGPVFHFVRLRPRILISVHPDLKVNKRILVNPKFNRKSVKLLQNRGDVVKGGGILAITRAAEF